MKSRSFIFTFLLSFFFAEAVLARNLPVPFTPQAPQANWSQPWEDACEEAAVAMIDAFYLGQADRRLTRSDAKKAILDAYNKKTSAYGFSLDENADQIARLINDFYSWEAQVVYLPTLEMIKEEIDRGRPVIVPAYGKALFNPYFRDGGPTYHTVVISGYDNDRQEFIVQEPGTSRGLDYRYSYARLLSAMHDYVPGGNTRIGRPVAIFTAPTRTLVKTAEEAAVYVLQNGEKRHIANEQAFLSRGWRWADIIIVSSKFLSTLREGAVIE